MVYIADTHAVVWFLEGSDRLGAAARGILLTPEAEVVIPTIALAEIAYLYGKRRVGIDSSAVIKYVSRAENCTIYPLDEAVVERLPLSLNIHDALIVATALVFRDVLKKDVAVITKDEEITRSGTVRALW